MTPLHQFLASIRPAINPPGLVRMSKRLFPPGIPANALNKHYAGVPFPPRHIPALIRTLCAAGVRPVIGGCVIKPVVGGFFVKYDFPGGVSKTLGEYDLIEFLTEPETPADTD